MPHVPHPAARRAIARVATLGCALCAAFAGASCASSESERNLAPLFSSYSSAQGNAEVEALGGMVVTSRDIETGKRVYWAIRPLVSNRYFEDGDRFAWFLPPLGFTKDDAETGGRVTQLLPIMRYEGRPKPNGFFQWSLLVLPGIYWASRDDGAIQRAFFPLFGVVEHFLSLDRGTFFLFPLWLRTERYGRTTDHVLWPFFSVSRGTGGPAWRAWPLVGHNHWRGRYNRWFAAWPIFHHQRNGLQYSDDQQQRSWMVWPLIGRSRRGPGRQTTVLWPFFGRTTDPETGFWAWDGPWPLVRFQGGDPERATRKRVWPFYSYYEGDGLVSRWYGWPIINTRHETYPNGSKSSLNVFPFWRSYERLHTPLYLAGGVVEDRGRPPAERPGVERWRKLWPLGKTTRAPGVSELHVIDLNPFQEVNFVDEHYAWLWELYSRRRVDETVRSRSMLGLWRREKDADEDRRSLSGLWSARDYVRAGKRAKERSWLFGLIRYRTVEDGGFRFLWPRVPGPGWPIARTPSSIVPEPAPPPSMGSIGAFTGIDR